MKLFRARECRQRAAFSLIELLVSIAVLAVIMVLVFNISSGTANLAQRSETKIEASANLRTALDRIGADLKAALAREDLPVAFPAYGESPSIEFFAYMPGYDGTRQLARLAYRIGERGLERGAQGYNWKNADSPFGNSTTVVIAPGNFDLLAPAVFRMAVGFYLSDGTYRSGPAPAEWTEISAIVVCLVMVDEKALTKAGWTPEQTGSLAAEFPEPAADESALGSWSQIANQMASSSGGSGGVPLPVAQGIEVRQRVFPVRSN